MKDLLLIFWAFLRLGCVSFGGPVAHMAYFHKEFVEKRRWLDEAHYADLVALCQFLPGPSSSQVGYAIGALRGGPAGGVAAWLGFTLPSAALMTAFALGMVSGGWSGAGGVLQGLKLAAVAIVADAVWKMGRKLCPDVSRAAVALLVAGLLLKWPSPWLQVAYIALGAVWGAYFLKLPSERSTAGPEVFWKGRFGVWLIAAFAVLLAASFLLPESMSFSAMGRVFYQTGALVFGGGHVILPLLEHRVVAPGWMDSDLFLSGYGAAQAVPGPLFSLAAYVGTAVFGNPLGGLYCLFMLYLPSFLLVPGVLPYWQQLRKMVRVRAGLCGANAVVVGLLLAAWINPICSTGVKHWEDGVIGLAGFLMLTPLKRGSWSVVLFCVVGKVLFGLF